MAKVRYPFNEHVVQELTREGTPSFRMVNLSEDELTILRSCIAAGANIYYPEISDSIEYWFDDMVTGSSWRQYRRRVWASEWEFLSGAPVLWQANTGSEYGGYWLQSPAAINDERHYRLSLRKGTYSISLRSVRGGSLGKAKFYLDADLIADLDFYNSVGQLNVQFTTGGFNVPADGDYDFMVWIYGKHASSSGYHHGASYYDFIRSGGG